MDNLLLNRMITPEADKTRGLGIVKKKQETLFEKLMSELHGFKILLKIQFRYAPVFLTIPKPLRQQPIE